MDEIEQRVSGIDQATLTKDGQGIAFRLLTDQGPLARLKFSLDELPEFIAFLCQVMAELHPEPRPTTAPTTIWPIGAGLASTADPAVSQLVVRLAGMDLGFALSSTQVAALGDDFARAAKLLSATGRPQ